MNGTPHKKIRGPVEGVEVKGAGPNSGHGTISVVHSDGTHTSYSVTLDSPPNDFVHIVGTAFKAMWNSKEVELTYVDTPGAAPRIVAIHLH